MRTVLAFLILTLSAGCSSEQTADRPQDARSQRARDSTIAESNLPGAGGVRGALRAADSAAARRARIDSLAETP
ncbi:MAG: hypothetical protein ACE5FP_07820 [Gemmatimonadota bacterium]